MNIFKSVVIVTVITGLSVISGMCRIATLVETSGEVSYLESGRNNWEPAGRDMELNKGDKIRTTDKSRAWIRFDTGHSAVVKENSEMVIESSDKNMTTLELFSGKLRSKVKKVSKDHNYKVKTPQAVCAVRGTDFEVLVIDQTTTVQVYEGLVEARELITGEAVNIEAGQYSDIIQNQKPSEPDVFSDSGETEQETAGQTDDTADEKDMLKESARMEMFEEISREAVLSRAAEEIKKAEYENGKALIDAGGNRVRLEEYIVRPQDNQFKYVVLNSREERLDFGKILFTFNLDLPEDLTEVTKTMFYTESEPVYILTDMTSVMSNTADSVNEEAHNGQMMPDDINFPTYWSHYFGDYSFSIKGKDRSRLELWSYSDANSDGIIQNSEYTYPLGEPVVETGWPAGSDTLYYLERNVYDISGEELVLEARDYIIDDDGNIQRSSDFENMSNTEFNTYLYGLNFEREYVSSEFSASIDLVFSSKLLIDSGMLTIPVPEDVD